MHSKIRKTMKVIGADGVPVGTVADAGDKHITLVAPHDGPHKSHRHIISNGLIATVEGDTVRLSANADVAISFEEEG
ncbi:MAG: hypothetical protein CFE37_01660 [Alphaproteobacteria bacterium PA4]|nr:MAG: hypothetical protein CFE37_01660 [Alphaproteobacteria bacterium PA4]